MPEKKGHPQELYHFYLCLFELTTREKGIPVGAEIISGWIPVQPSITQHYIWQALPDLIFGQRKQTLGS